MATDRIRSWLRELFKTGAAKDPMSEAVVVSVDGERTYPSPLLAGYIADLETRLVSLAAENKLGQYEGREEVSSGSRLLFFTGDARKLSTKFVPALNGSPIQYALAVKWSRDPLSSVWHQVDMDTD